MDYKDYFRARKITVMGLGLLGGALNDTIFLANQGAELTVTDLKTDKELSDPLEKLSQFKNIKFVLGEHRLEDFRNADIILQPGNVPMDSVFLAEAKKNNVPVYVSESLFAEYAEAEMVGVTGTRGKSTTVQMIYEVLKNHSNDDRKIFLGGNVKNVSTLALLQEAQTKDCVVLELDSWALHGMGDIHKSPHIAVFTTFFDDHLNYYKGDRNLYLEDKAQIFKYQNEKDFLILGEQVEDIIRSKYGAEIKSKIIVAKSSNLPKDIKIKIPGEHNRYDAVCAFEALKVLGLAEDEIKKGLEEFNGVEGRLQLVKEWNGIKIYNDTTATTPEATMAGLKALGGPASPSHFAQRATQDKKATQDKIKTVVLILGGADKTLNMSELVDLIPTICKKVILLPGTGTAKLKTLGEKFEKLNAVPVTSLKEAFEFAKKSAETGDVILFSPAFASFGLFKNEFDRGEQFNSLVSELS